MYAKLFASLYQGTLRGQSDEILVFTNLLAHSDEHGIVDKHWRAIAEETGISRDRVEAAIINLEAPDAESRSPESEGRRIIRMDEHRAWGWQIVNHGKYRAIRNEADRKQQNRQAQSRFREKSANSKQIVSSVSDSKQNKPIQIHITDTDTDTEAIQNIDCAAEAATLVITQKSVTTPECQHSEIIELYHELLPMCPRIKAWTAARQKSLRTRWNEDAARQSLIYWGNLFRYVAESDFLCGRSNATPGREPFLVSLEWIAKAGHFVNIIEGKYHSGKKL